MKNRSPEEARRQTRLRVLLALLLATLVTLGVVVVQSVNQEIDDEAALAVVVDSLPFAIGYTWGFEEDRPYTVVLDSRVLVAGGPDRLRLPGPRGRDEGPDETHSESWMTQQSAKQHVVGTCSSAAGADACTYGLATMAATMVATISGPTRLSEEESSVEVSLSRLGFHTVVEFLLADAQGTWSVTEIRILLIT